MLSSSVVTGLPHLALHFLLSLSHCSSCQVTFCCCNWSAATWVSRVRTVGSRPSSNQSKPVYSLSCYLLLLWVTRVRTVTSKFFFFFLFFFFLIFKCYCSSCHDTFFYDDWSAVSWGVGVKTGIKNFWFVWQSQCYPVVMAPCFLTGLLHPGLNRSEPLGQSLFHIFQ